MAFTRRRLPHVYVAHRPLFITFRLYGSLPTNRPFSAAGVTSGEAFAAMDRLLDEARSGPMFLKQPAVAQLVRESILYGAGIGHYDLHAWTIMANHVHLLLTPHVEPSKLLRSLKSVTATQTNRLLNRAGRPFWQEESYDHLVRSEEEFRRIQRYIENNPVRAGLAAHPEDYPWSSAGAGSGPAAG